MTNIIEIRLWACHSKRHRFSYQQMVFDGRTLCRKLSRTKTHTWLGASLRHPHSTDYREWPTIIIHHQLYIHQFAIRDQRATGKESNLINQSLCYCYSRKLIPWSHQSTWIFSPIPKSTLNNFVPCKSDSNVTLIPHPLSWSRPRQEFAETAMNELLGWYGYGTDTAKRNGQQSVDPEDGSASGVSITKKDSLPRNRQPRAARVNEAAAAARYSPPSLSNSPQTTSRASPGGASIENNLGG